MADCVELCSHDFTRGFGYTKEDEAEYVFIRAGRDRSGLSQLFRSSDGIRSQFGLESELDPNFVIDDPESQLPIPSKFQSRIIPTFKTILCLRLSIYHCNLHKRTFVCVSSEINIKSHLFFHSLTNDPTYRSYPTF